VDASRAVGCSWPTLRTGCGSVLASLSCTALSSPSPTENSGPARLRIAQRLDKRRAQAGLDPFADYETRRNNWLSPSVTASRSRSGIRSPAMGLQPVRLSWVATFLPISLAHESPPLPVPENGLCPPLSGARLSTVTADGAQETRCYNPKSIWAGSVTLFASFACNHGGF